MDPINILYLKFIPPNTLLTLKIISSVATILLIAGISFFLSRTGWLNYRYTQDVKDWMTFKSGGTKRFEKILKKVNQRMESQSINEYKLGLIEIDNLLGEALIKLGYQNGDINSILNSLKEDTIGNAQEILSARKIIGNIINDPDYSMTLDRAKDIVKAYEKVFRDLNVI